MEKRRVTRDPGKSAAMASSRDLERTRRGIPSDEDQVATVRQDAVQPNNQAEATTLRDVSAPTRSSSPDLQVGPATRAELKLVPPPPPRSTDMEATQRFTGIPAVARDYHAITPTEDAPTISDELSPAAVARSANDGPRTSPEATATSLSKTEDTAPVPVEDVNQLMRRRTELVRNLAIPVGASEATVEMAIQQKINETEAPLMKLMEDGQMTQDDLDGEIDRIEDLLRQQASELRSIEARLHMIGSEEPTAAELSAREDDWLGPEPVVTPRNRIDTTGVDLSAIPHLADAAGIEPVASVIEEPVAPSLHPRPDEMNLFTHPRPDEMKLPTTQQIGPIFEKAESVHLPSVTAAHTAKQEITDGVRPQPRPQPVTDAADNFFNVPPAEIAAKPDVAYNEADTISDMPVVQPDALFDDGEDTIVDKPVFDYADEIDPDDLIEDNKATAAADAERKIEPVDDWVLGNNNTEPLEEAVELYKGLNRQTFEEDAKLPTAQEGLLPFDELEDIDPEARLAKSEELHTWTTSLRKLQLEQKAIIDGYGKITGGLMRRFGIKPERAKTLQKEINMMKKYHDSVRQQLDTMTKEAISYLPGETLRSPNALMEERNRLLSETFHFKAEKSPQLYASMEVPDHILRARMNTMYERYAKEVEKDLTDPRLPETQRTTAAIEERRRPLMQKFDDRLWEAYGHVRESENQLARSIEVMDDKVDPAIRFAAPTQRTTAAAQRAKDGARRAMNKSYTI